MLGDWVKLHRRAISHPVFSDKPLWHLFTWCLMKANFREGAFMGKRIPRGSFATGRNSAAEELGDKPITVYRRLQRLEELGCISIESNNQFTTITVCNYESYQSFSEDELPEMNNGVTTDEQRSNNGVTTDEQRSNTIEEGKKERKKEGKKKTTAVFPAIPENLLGEAFSQLWGQWETHRREIKKPLTPTAAGQQLAKLSAMGPARAEAALRHSIANGWQGIFEPEAEAANGRKPRTYSPDNLFAGGSQ